MATANKLQHWVPQFYLRQFAIAETRAMKTHRVWAVPVEDGPAIVTNTRNVAGKAFLYTWEREDGTRDDKADEWLRRNETFSGAHWHRLASGDLSEPVRKVLSVFMASLLLRHPARIDLVRETHQRLLSALEAAPKDSEGRPLVDTVEIGGVERAINLSDWEAFRNLSQKDYERQFVEHIEGGGWLPSVLLGRKPWSMVISDTEVFATSDHPVVVINPNVKHPAVGRPETRIYFPLTPTRLLVIGDPRVEDGLCYPLLEGGERMFNFYTWSRATKFLFTCDDPLHTFRGINRFADEFTADLN